MRSSPAPASPPPGRVVSVNVGGVSALHHRGEAVQSGIVKVAVQGRVALGAGGLEFDAQADLTVHGGPDRAAYLYSSDDLAWWAERLGGPLPPGMLGENLTVTGLRDDDVLIGDLIRVGEAVVQPTGPREPCFKLGIRMGDRRFPARFREANRCGFYVRVIEEGAVAAGDPIEIVARDPAGISIGDLHRLFVGHGRDEAALRTALTVSALPVGWREWCEERLANIETGVAR
jgi:MOSC domain-containing protein YiiM